MAILDSEAAQISKMVEEFVVLDSQVPKSVRFLDPTQLLEEFRKAKPALILIRKICKQLSRLGPLRIFNPTVKKTIWKINQKKTNCDGIQFYFEFLNLLCDATDEEVKELAPSSDRVTALRNCKELKDELGELFGRRPASTDLTGDDIYTSGFFVDFTFDLREWCYNSKFAPEEHLKSISEVLSLIDPEDFAERTLSLGTIVLSQGKVPTGISTQLERLKQCYRLGLNEIAVVFCRALLEAAFVKYLGVDRGWRFSKLLSKIRSRHMLHGDLIEKAKTIGDAAGKILHEDNYEEESSASTIEKIKDTYRIVEELFGGSGP
ncbi:hypothetical protein MYX84_08665 [Acidobacteria bacterium AH-259-O06]|nr:hypothetical protein [Acidobacteria bacterium AH-259-O06]